MNLKFLSTLFLVSISLLLSAKGLPHCSSFQKHKVKVATVSISSTDCLTDCSYTVRGKFADNRLAVKTVFLQQVNDYAGGIDLAYSSADSAIVAPDGTFRFSGRAARKPYMAWITPDKPLSLYLSGRTDQSPCVGKVIIEPGNIKASVFADYATGTPLNDRLKQLLISKSKITDSKDLKIWDKKMYTLVLENMKNPVGKSLYRFFFNELLRQPKPDLKMNRSMIVNLLKAGDPDFIRRSFIRHDLDYYRITPSELHFHMPVAEKAAAQVSDKPYRYRLEGQFKESSHNGKKLFLQRIDLLSGDFQKRVVYVPDSTVVSPDGRFIFEGHTGKEPYMAYLTDSAWLQQQKELNLSPKLPPYSVIIEPGTIKAKVSVEKQVCTTSGTPLNNQFTAIVELGRTLSQSIALYHRHKNDAVKAVKDSLRADSVFRVYNRKSFDFTQRNIKNTVGYCSLFCHLVWPAFAAPSQSNRLFALLDSLNPIVRADQRVRNALRFLKHDSIFMPSANLESYREASLYNRAGLRTHLPDYLSNHKLVLLYFWESKTALSLDDMAYMTRLYTKYNNKGLEIVGINCDRNIERCHRAIEKYSIAWPQFMQGQYGSLYGLGSYQSLPYTVLYDHTGRIIAFNFHYEDLEQKIQEVLQ